MSHSLHSGENGGRLETVPTKSKPSRRSENILGHVCEYWLNCFVSAEGKNGGQFYTPSCALRGIEADFGPEHADTFRRDLHPAPPRRHRDARQREGPDFQHHADSGVLLVPREKQCCRF